jgi:hypothetical protein
VGSFTCRPQVAALVGPRDPGGGPEWEAGAEVWPAAGNRSLLPPLPVDYVLGTAGYLSGSLYFCGGCDLKDPALQPRPTSHSLRPPARRWEEAAPLLQVRPRHPPLCPRQCHGPPVQLLKRVGRSGSSEEWTRMAISCPAARW